MVVRQAGELRRLDLAAELRGERLRVRCAHAEREERADVPEDSVTDLGFKLGEVLLRRCDVEGSVERARKAHDEFQAARQSALREIDAEIAELNVRRREVLAWGKICGSNESRKERGRPPKENKAA